MFKQTLKAAALAGIAISMSGAPANALVVVPGSSVATMPSDAVMARWGGSASGVVISSQHILTTRHQLGGVGTTVKVDGTNYTVAQVTVILDPDTPANNLDLRVARLETFGGNSPNFTQTVSIYGNTDEIGKTLVLGGYGEGRGTAITLGPATLGYNWDGNDGTLRWGANLVSGSATDEEFDANITYTNDIITAVFDDPDTLLSNAVDGEATLARDDSGGGWFINDAGTWKLVAINQGVENTDEALFGEELAGIRLSSYATQINNAVPEPTSAALLLVGAGCLASRRRR